MNASADVLQCGSATFIRDPDNNCEFPECPVCGLDVLQCGSATFNRDPGINCEFPECPTCGLDVLQCGSATFNRDPGNNCEFPECPQCGLDVEICNGETVNRDPGNNCEFPFCPSLAPTEAPETDSPTLEPTDEPTPEPTVEPTPEPTEAPETDSPTEPPTAAPTKGTPEPTQSPSASPSKSPSSSPSDRPSRTPSLSPSAFEDSAAPSSMPSGSVMPSVMPSSMPSLVVPTSMPTVNETYLDCSTYTHTLEVPGLEGVTLEYVVNMFPLLQHDSNMTNNDTMMEQLHTTTMMRAGHLMVMDDHNMTKGHQRDGNETLYGPPILSIRVTFDGQGWLGFGVSDVGGMVGSSAVLGVITNETTLTGDAHHYNLTFEDNAPGYELFDEQTLLDATVTQNENGTVLTFTRLLDDDYGLPVNGSGLNYFIVAHGEDNNLGYHLMTGRSSFNMTLTPCTFDPVGNGTLSAEDIAEITGDMEPFSAAGEDLDDVAAPPTKEEETEEDANRGATVAPLESGATRSVAAGLFFVLGAAMSYAGLV